MPFASALVGQTLTCPVCAKSLTAHADRYTCDGCRGVFVETAALEEMVRRMRNGPWVLDPPIGPDGRRACPVCSKVMRLELVHTTELDHCPDHGVWFDDEELAAALLTF